jgi:hypothetical protein
MVDFPPAFGSSWETFCAEWCLGTALGYSRDEVQRGLTTLSNLWRSKVEELTAAHRAGTRGTARMAWAIDCGLMLSDCQSITHFGPLLERLITGSRAAYAELVLVASLHRLGYFVVFESPDPGSADCMCGAGDSQVAFEVYAPDRSHASHDEHALVAKLETALKTAVPHSRTELGILSGFTETDIETALAALRAAPSSAWVNVGDWARLRRVDKGEDLPRLFDGGGVHLTIGGETEKQGASTSIVIRWESSDSRAEHSLQQKRAQVTRRGHPRNVVAIDVCAVGGIREWPEVIAGLEGSEYETIGATLFFDQGSLGPPEAISRRWRVVANPCARAQIPAELLARIESLDQSTAWGLTRASRLSMQDNR